MSREREEVIPVVKEELEVGKRVTERRYRVKSYIVERPIEKTVTVRDERVEIEHRPISRTGDLSMPQEREIEVIERHEEPFAEKRVTGTEEIVVRKEVVERPETVRGTVRETKVDVDKEPVDKTAATTTTTDRTGRHSTPYSEAHRQVVPVIERLPLGFGPPIAVIRGQRSRGSRDAATSPGITKRRRPRGPPLDTGNTEGSRPGSNSKRGQENRCACCGTGCAQSPFENCPGAVAGGQERG